MPAGNSLAEQSITGFFSKIETGWFVELNISALEVLAVEGEEGALSNERGGSVNVVGNPNVGEVLAEGESLLGNGGGMGQKRKGFNSLPGNTIGSFARIFAIHPHPLI